MARPLTERQREVLEFIRKTVVAKGYPPSIREIGQQFGIRSTNGVRGILQALERTPLRIFGLSHFWVVEKRINTDKQINVYLCSSVVALLSPKIINPIYDMPCFAAAGADQGMWAFVRQAATARRAAEETTRVGLNNILSHSPGADEHAGGELPPIPRQLGQRIHPDQQFQRH